MPKADLEITPPLLNSAGFLGFEPDFRGLAAFQKFGAFVTNPISLKPRPPAKNACQADYPGGFIFHNGYPNPGLRRALHNWSGSWKRSRIPVIVSILPQNATEIFQMIPMVEACEGISAIEIGLPPGTQLTDIYEITQNVMSELALILRLPFGLAAGLAEDAADRIQDSELSAITIQPPKGSLSIGTGKMVTGRMYGPALFPQTLSLSQRLADMGIPLIASGGVYLPEQADLLLAAGSMAVQLDAVLWKDPGLISWDHRVVNVR